ncbi:hypothetical protein GCM10009627_20470 [Curtobacterium herbarum]|uniref:Uncharacterized protein n=1 Tax=Curtobacterium herbarum TaxID=150122 RepID=A0ABP4K4A9_9MICO
MREARGDQRGGVLSGPFGDRGDGHAGVVHGAGQGREVEDSDEAERGERHERNGIQFRVSVA